jgi:hypothetical protein
MFGAKLSNRHDEGGRVMTYDVDEISELELERLREFRRQRCPRAETTPTIKMIIGEWYVDELGVRTREITAHE